MRQRNSLILGVMLTVLLLAGCAGKGTRGQTNDAASAQALVDEAAHVLSLSLDKDGKGVLKKLIARARGVMIIPAVGDVSFLFSLGGGNAVVMANTSKGWAGPVFLSKGSAGFGFQAGISKQSGVMLYMHEDDVLYLLRTGAVLKGQARATILGSDYRANETPEFYESGMVYFIGEQSGLYAGIAINGGGFSDRIALNEIYNGVEGGDPIAILYDAGSMPDGALLLRDMLDQAGIAGQKMLLSGDKKEKDGTEVPSD